MANTAWVNKILYRKGSDDNYQEESFPIGTTFDKVYDDASHKFSLQQLINLLKKFFSRQSFMLYSKNEPTIYSKTMEWYALSGDIEHVDAALVVIDPNEQTFN